MERRDYNRDGYSRDRVDRYYVDTRDGERGGYGERGGERGGYGERGGERVGERGGERGGYGERGGERGGYGDDRYYGGAQDGDRGGYGGDRYYGGGAQEAGRGGYGGDRYYGGAQDVGRGGYSGERYYRGAQDVGRGGQDVGRGGYGGGDRYHRVVDRVGYGGDRYYVDALDDDRGGYGGESGAGYRPRSVGRDRSYPHPYNNRPQEQYGGSSRRESGGGGVRESGGGGVRESGSAGVRSQSFRTPPYQRQNPARVQDRLGRDREPRRSPVEYGQSHSVKSRSRSRSPFRSLSLTRSQNPIADRIQEVPLPLPPPPPLPHREVQSVPAFIDDPDHPYVPMKRPDHGSLAMKSVKLLVNHFPVKFDPSKAILRYDVDIKPQSSSSSRSAKKPIPKPDLRLIQEQLCSDNPNEFPLLHTAYDGEKNIYSAITLPEGTYNVELHGRSYTCTIKYGTKLGLSKLQDFLKGNLLQIPRDVLQALDVVMKANLYREKVSVGKGMYPRVHRKEDDLYNGVAAYRGSQQSLKVTSNGLVMCLDYAAVPFRKRMPVFDFLKECIQGIREVADIERFGTQVIRALKGLKVTVTHRRTNQKYTVCGLSDKPTRNISFDLVDLEGKKDTEVVMLTEYFREKWGKEIKHKDMPCLNLGNTKKPNYVPMEFCILAEDKRFPKEQLGKEAARKLKELSLLNPNCREREIHDLVRDEYSPGKNGAKSVKNFEVEVGMSMTEVDGRVMAPPQLKLGSSSGKTMSTTVDKFKCHWNLLQGKTLVTAKAAERWAVIDFTGGDRRNSLNTNYFIGKLMKRCESIGIQMEEPIIVHQTNMRELSDVNKLNRLLKEVMEECRRRDSRRLQMIVCVMAEKHDGYKYLKWVSETQIGVITQCCLSFNANKANDQFLANLGMKINAKLGGSNVELIERYPRFNGSDHFMFIGADVNHPTGFNKASPSVAAVVGSVNWPAATRYAARVSPQPHRKEEIVNFGSLCLDLVNTYEQRNGIKPNRIVVFRDGVSDGQFDMVLNKEMVDMKKALYSGSYRPAVTFVVAQKRHTTRLFLNNGNGVGNIPPGTVVDTTIVQPFEFDFYLCSHFGGMGTSKPTHYSVIWDENGFTSDEMQKLIYHLCYIFARCTKPVSLVPPVYYADLVAYRGRMFQEVAAESESGDSGMESSSFDRFFYNLEDHLRDSMFFI